MACEFPVQPVKLTLGGHLSSYDAQRRSRLQLNLEQSMLLSELLIQLAISVSEVDLVPVNGEQTNLPETWIAPGDKLELCSPMGGG